jgi:hypothetical protein
VITVKLTEAQLRFYGHDAGWFFELGVELVPGQSTRPQEEDHMTTYEYVVGQHACETWPALADGGAK